MPAGGFACQPLRPDARFWTADRERKVAPSQFPWAAVCGWQVSNSLTITSNSGLFRSQSPRSSKTIRHKNAVDTHFPVQAAFGGRGILLFGALHRCTYDSGMAVCTASSCCEFRFTFNDLKEFSKKLADDALHSAGAKHIHRVTRDICAPAPMPPVPNLRSDRLNQPASSKRGNRREGLSVAQNARKGGAPKGAGTQVPR